MLLSEAIEMIEGASGWKDRFLAATKALGAPTKGSLRTPQATWFSNDKAETKMTFRINTHDDSFEIINPSPKAEAILGAAKPDFFGDKTLRIPFSKMKDAKVKRFLVSRFK